MDFFEAQARAKQRTTRLVWLFVLAVFGTVLGGYAAAMFFFQASGRSQRIKEGYWQYQQNASWPAGGFHHAWWNPQLLGWITLGTITIVGLASLYKWSQMRAGGAAIAEMVGGRRVDQKTTDLRERKLLNVVEEMAIASGIPMPAVFVLDQEPGLNAFAAGLTTSDAAVAVTRGTLEKLTRDELQAVIGHEFSHILNGDMKLNVKLTAIVFGILVIGLMGRGILYSFGRGRVRVSGGGKNKGGGVALIFSAGVALMIIGYIGYFFGRLIQAAVSRQREFLADASAVQFTRNPSAIAGALKKIGGYTLNGRITNKQAPEIGHFFFAQAFKSYFGGLWATHPPLDERIRAVEPQWNGKLFEPEEVVDINQESFAMAGFGGGQRYTADETLARVHAATPDLPPPIISTPLPFQPKAAVATIGALTESHFRHAHTLLEAIPTRLREATRDTVTAQVLVYGLLLNGTRKDRDQQQSLVAQHASADAAAALADLRSALSLLDPAARLPLLQLALPALRDLSKPDLDRFCTTLDELVHADGRVSPFEFALQKMLLSQLQLARQPNRAVQFMSFSGVRDAIAVVLSSLARLSSQDTTMAFAQGAAQLPLLNGQLKLLDEAASRLEHVDAALDRLAVSSLVIKQQVLIAAGHVIASDGTVSVEEGELFRAFAATLDCPMPSLNSGA